MRFWKSLRVVGICLVLAASFLGRAWGQEPFPPPEPEASQEHDVSAGPEGSYVALSAEERAVVENMEFLEMMELLEHLEVLQNWDLISDSPAGGQPQAPAGEETRYGDLPPK